MRTPWTNGAGTFCRSIYATPASIWTRSERQGAVRLREPTARPLTASMKILQLISSEAYAGAESMMVTLAHSLSLLGCESRIAVFQDMRTPHIEVVEEAVRQGIAVELITCRGRFDYNALRQLHAQVSRLQVQVLHTHGYKADIYGFAATRRNPVNLVATCHNWPSRVHRMRTYAALDRLVLRCFDRVVTPSPVVEHLLLRSGIPRQRLSCIGNGIDLERFRGAEPALRLEADCGQDPLVGFVGRLVTDKGCAVLLAAATTVLAQRRDVRFVFVARGRVVSNWSRLQRALAFPQA